MSPEPQLLNVENKGEELIKTINIDIDALAHAKKHLDTSPRELFY
jgi:hypothetical protein